MSILTHCITDLRSALAVIRIMKQQNPALDRLAIPSGVLAEIYNDVELKDRTVGFMWRDNALTQRSSFGPVMYLSIDGIKLYRESNGT